MDKPAHCWWCVALRLSSRQAYLLALNRLARLRHECYQCGVGMSERARLFGPGIREASMRGTNSLRMWVVSRFVLAQVKIGPANET